MCMQNMIFGNIMDESLFLLNYMHTNTKWKVHLSVSKIKLKNRNVINVFKNVNRNMCMQNDLWKHYGWMFISSKLHAHKYKMKSTFKCIWNKTKIIAGLKF